ncbi:MAG TPA: VWA domain-containing protein, partial [Pyrinomonadaceae bacterium]|nr:VWA domain-containing protein [Pyrinomonadaceae bacterium]
LKSVEARRGRYVRAVSNRTIGAKIALGATLSAAALDVENVDSEMRAGVDSSDGLELLRVLNVSRSLRYKRFKQKEGTLFIFAIDASGSMALNRIAQAKGALARLLQQSYIKRDRVALISFRGAGADVMLRPTGSSERAKRILDTLSLGGPTPLAAGLSCALEVARQSRRRGAGRIVLLLFTDGRANRTLSTDDSLSGNAIRGRIEYELKLVGAALGQASVQTIVVDTQNRFTSGGEAQKLAKMIGGRYVYLPPISSNGEGFLSLAGQARQNVR